MNIRIVKTNKTTVTKEFQSLQEASDYADRNTYAKGTAELFIEGIKHEHTFLSENMWAIAGILTSMILNERN